LESLEDRTLLDASGPVIAALTTLANDSNQAVSDAINLRGGALQQDASKIKQDVSNVIDQVNNSPGGNVLLDFIMVLRGLSTMQVGAVAVEAGVAASAEPGGVAIGPSVALAGAAVFTSGEEMTITGAEKFNQDLINLLSGGQQKPPPSPPPPPSPHAHSSIGTWTATLVPSFVDGDVKANTPQKLSFTLNADGSGSLSITPFAGTPTTVNFPAGTAQFNADGSVSVSYTSPSSAVQIGVDPASPSADGNTLKAFEIFVDNTATNDEATFFPATLNRQG
jgi:hypothetical protein